MTNSRLSQQEAARELLTRRAARKSLIDFTVYTKADFQVGAHHQQIAQALESVERGECDRLMIFAPPRHTKSELASRRFPAWYLGRHPDRQLIAATYSGDFALDFGREVRGIVDSEEFRALYPGVTLAQDSKAANRWHTNQGGVSVYVGVGGPITGRGAHCFVAGTLVDTTAGKVSIEELKNCPASIKIMSYGNGRVEAKDLQAFSERQGTGIYRITTAAGRVVEATGDHPFFVAGRYIEARQLAAGNPLLCLVREDVHPAGLRDAQGAAEELRGRLLLGGLLQSASGDEVSPQVHQVCGPRGEKDAEVLPSVSRDAECGSGQVATNSEELPDVQYAVHSSASRQRSLRGILQQALRGARTLAQDVWSGKSEVQGWRDSTARATALGAGLSVDSTEDSGAGRLSLCGVRRCGVEAGGASPRQLAHEQCGIESGDALFSLPQQVARGEGWKVECDSVALVERVRETATVYDIQVADNHNFFANGVLVHNCALIDDPFKNREEADSEVRRETVWKWYTSTLRTRLMPGGAIVLILTRWHEDDLAGRLLAQQPDEWKVIELQAIRDEGTSQETALWPQWYDLAALKRIKADIGPRDWSALYQQRPAPDEGTFFQRAWFKHWTDRPKALAIYGTSDYAVTDGDGDYTVHRIWGVAPDGGLYRLGGWRDRTSSDVWIERQIDLIQQHKPFAWFGEAGVIQKAIEPMLTRRMRERDAFCRMEWLPSIHDKPTRARGFQARAAMGCVWFEQGAELDEFLTFPAGKHDDDVDCASLIGRALDMAHPAIAATPPKEKKRDIWDKSFGAFDDEDTDWKTV